MAPSEIANNMLYRAVWKGLERKTRNNESTRTYPYASTVFPIVTWEAPTRPPKLYSASFSPFPKKNVVQGQAAGASRHQQQKDEAKESRPLTSIEDGPESPWEVGKEVGNCHLSAEEEGDGTGEQASGNKEGPEKLQDSSKP